MLNWNLWPFMKYVISGKKHSFSLFFHFLIWKKTWKWPFQWNSHLYWKKRERRVKEWLWNEFILSHNAPHQKKIWDPLHVMTSKKIMSLLRYFLLSHGIFFIYLFWMKENNSLRSEETKNRGQDSSPSTPRSNGSLVYLWKPSLWIL